MQQLWLEGLAWHEEISEESLRIRNEFATDFLTIEEVSIPLWIQFTPADKVQIHGFCDASKAAYCAMPNRVPHFIFKFIAGKIKSRSYSDCMCTTPGT